MHETATQAETRWMESAACREVDPELFFPGERGAPERRADTHLRLADALDSCAVCVVREECLEYAIERPWLEGIWGGATPQQRKSIRRRRKPRPQAM